MSGLDFGAKIKYAAAGMKDAVEQTRRAILITLFSAIVDDTPVLEGRLRGDWQTTLTAPAVGNLTSIRAESDVTAEIFRVLGEAKGDVTIYFTNNEPYAYAIEFEGWSRTKAPEGMVRRNLARITSIVAESIAKART